MRSGVDIDCEGGGRRGARRVGVEVGGFDGLWW